MHLINDLRFARGDFEVKLWVLRFCVAIDRRGIEFRCAERALRMVDARTQQRARRWEIATLRLKSVLLRWAEQHCKAGFNPDQPRWPAGSGRISGQWSGGSGSAGVDNDREFSSQRRYRAEGHHTLPQAHYRHLPLSPETRKVFDEAKTGRLHVVGHRWDELHKQYNRATRELMDRFMSDHGIQPEQMTPDHARSLLDAIERSRDSRIANYLKGIRFREYLYRLRTGVRGNE
jgi:hypothetical protein